jgi:hypothetical protein
VKLSASGFIDIKNLLKGIRMENWNGWGLWLRLLAWMGLSRSQRWASFTASTDIVNPQRAVQRVGQSLKHSVWVLRM